MELNASLDLPDDLEQELRRAGKVENEQAARRIQELEDMLSEKGVQEVNELLLWVKGGFEYFNPEQLDDLLTATRLFRDAGVADTVPATQPDYDLPQSSEGEAQDVASQGETISTQAISLLSLREPRDSRVFNPAGHQLDGPHIIGICHSEPDTNQGGD